MGTARKGPLVDEEGFALIERFKAAVLGNWNNSTKNSRRAEVLAAQNILKALGINVPNAAVRDVVGRGYGLEWRDDT